MATDLLFDPAQAGFFYRAPGGRRVIMPVILGSVIVDEKRATRRLRWLQTGIRLPLPRRCRDVGRLHSLISISRSAIYTVPDNATGMTLP